MKGQIQSVEVTYFVHGTEDPDKLGEAAARLLGPESVPETELLEGHFGNKIARVRIRLVGDAAESGVRRIFSMMPRELKRQVRADLGSYLDEHSALFLRFDKQQLVQGGLALGSGDPVRVKVKPRLFRIRSGAGEYYGRLMEGSRAP